VLYAKSTNTDRQNVLLENKSSLIEKYHYHDEKMKYLNHILQTENPKSIDELFYQCMQLKQSLKEKCLNSISQTAVSLLKNEMFFEHNQMTKHELNAHKTLYITMDCIDLIVNTYESDFYEVCKELHKNTRENQPQPLNDSGSIIKFKLT